MREDRRQVRIQISGIFNHLYIPIQTEFASAAYSHTRIAFLDVGAGIIAGSGQRALDSNLTKTGQICHKREMPTSTNTRSVSVSLVVVPEVSAAIVYGFHEMFTSVGTMWEQLTGERQAVRRMKPRIVGATKTPVRTTIAATLVADHTFDEAHRSDIVIVGDLNLAPGASPKGRWQAETAWLRDQYKQGAVVCSVCTGSLMLAEAGLLRNREATSHWSAGSMFQRYYPDTVLQPERILVPSGQDHRVITAGGSGCWTDLALYLVARFCGEEEARHIAKIFVLGDRTNGQMSFAAMARPEQHNDEVIARCQAWIASHYSVANPVSEMAMRSGLTERTFKRRFLKSTGYTPISYVQTLRIEEAKHMLETASDAIDDIAMEVGYEDPNSFRRLFKRTTGITPNKYRTRFKSVAIS